MTQFDPTVDDYDKGYWDAFAETMAILEEHLAEMRRRGWINMQAGTRRDIGVLKAKFGKGKS